jgi:hypothetical protein
VLDLTVAEFDYLLARHEEEEKRRQAQEAMGNLSFGPR